MFPSSPGVLTVYAPNGWRWVPDEKPLTVLLKALAGAAVKWNGLPALVEVVEGMRRRAARPVKARQVIAVEVPGGSPLVKAPGYLDLTLGAPLRVVEVDGEPIATPVPTGAIRRLYQRVQPEPGRLFPGPRKIRSKDSGDLVLRALSVEPLTGDERSAGLLRSDASLLRLLAFGLSGG